MKTITEAEYRKMFFPIEGWLFVEKDMLERKTSGGIILPDQAISKNVRWAMTGKIIAKSPFPPTEADWHREIWEFIQVGDKVGFSGTTPIMSPCPPYFRFETGENKEEGKFIVFHVADVLGIIVEKEEDMASVLKRFKEVSNG